MATTGDWDLVCHGHDHKANIESVPNIKGGTTILADPGSVAGLDGPATYILVDLETMACELLTVPQWPSDGQTAS
jgi:predicted phosphodiesterase